MTDENEAPQRPPLTADEVFRVVADEANLRGDVDQAVEGQARAARGLAKAEQRAKAIVEAAAAAYERAESRVTAAVDRHEAAESELAAVEAAQPDDVEAARGRLGFRSRVKAAVVGATAGIRSEAHRARVDGEG